MKNGNRNKALEWYKKALSIDPEFPSAIRTLRDLEED
ncbi:MAG: tetratricopeptide repeat protein [Cytophagales bacterium]|nr:tetratricopeptide repeat protein [Cytophagales bacterium]